MKNLKNNPLVSVLMTVYNREKYIMEAIESVMVSTYQNWELIIVDDQSKDSSLEIAQSYAEKDSRIQVYLNAQNLGDYPNRNQAASYAKGKYLKYVDADDMIYPYGLEQLVFYMEQFPMAGYGLCSMKADKNAIFPIILSPKEAYKRHYVEQNPIFHRAPLSSIIRKSAFDKIKGFTGKRMLGDFEMWHLLSLEFNVVLMPGGIVWYREHDDQEMTSYIADPIFPFKYLLLAREILKQENCPLNETEVKLAIDKLEHFMARSVLSALKHHSISKAIELKQLGELSFANVATAFLSRE